MKEWEDVICVYKGFLDKQVFSFGFQVLGVICFLGDKMFCENDLVLLMGKEWCLLRVERVLKCEKFFKRSR